MNTDFKGSMKTCSGGDPETPLLQGNKKNSDRKEEAYKKLQQQLDEVHQNNTSRQSQSYNQSNDQYQPINKNGSKCYTFCSYLPQAVCFGVFAVVIIFCIIDFHKVSKMFHQFIAWVRLNPGPAVGASVAIYTFCICFVLPITAFHIMLAYTYSQVFDNEYEGFAFTVPIIFLGILTGALCAFLISRYMFKDFVKGQIQNSPWLANNMRAINELLVAQGTLIVGLVRLTFAPFGITSYLFGVTSITLCQFLLGTCSYTVNILMQAFIGCSLYVMQKEHSSGSEQNKTEYLIFIVELVITVCITAIMGYYAKQMVQEKLEQFAQEYKEENNQNEQIEPKEMKDTRQVSHPVKDIEDDQIEEDQESLIAGASTAEYNPKSVKS